MDWRNIQSGLEIPTESYSDQPYVLRTDDGAWLCIMTTGSGREGEHGQHIVSMRSLDQGKSWTDLSALEPADGPEASYAVPLLAPGGRIFCFYNHNSDNLRQVRADPDAYPDGWCRRVDSQGHFVFKYSDDHGKTWSEKRYDIPVRQMQIDRENPYGGTIRFFWNVGKAFSYAGSAYVPLHKVGGFGHGFFTRSEGVLLQSDNLFSEPDPQKITWQTLPDGSHGLSAPAGGGPIAEEQSFTVLSDGSFYCVYRTVDGHPACSYSRDGGHTWTHPQYKTYPDGQLFKHPRAANFVWRCSNGQYLYWFHNHGGKSYEDRNPVWLSCGIETDSSQGKIIQWSEPEIVLYDDDPMIRISYPDLLEDKGTFYLFETQKDKARVHPLDEAFLSRLFKQQTSRQQSNRGLLIEVIPDPQTALFPECIDMPILPPLLIRDDQQPDHRSKNTGAGATIECWFCLNEKPDQQTIIDSRKTCGKGFAVQLTKDLCLELILNDGCSENRWRSDPLQHLPGKMTHLVVIIDGGPRIVSFVINGKLHDGGNRRQFGWGRISPWLHDFNGENQLHIKSCSSISIDILRIYGLALQTSEAIGNFKARVD